HHTNNVKELTKIRSGQPALLELSFEDLAILDVGDRSQRKPEVITASVEWHLGVSDESVNRKNRIFSNFLQKPGKGEIQRPYGQGRGPTRDKGSIFRAELLPDRRAAKTVNRR
ncbi:hypothetical protein, partial [Sphingobium estronivorans]|uniref:hypothetical protein n=1 Tax=Sphingobium estronivorans TaxID=1577690 RepID=UPI0013C34CDE